MTGVQTIGCSSAIASERMGDRSSGVAEWAEVRSQECGQVNISTVSPGRSLFISTFKLFCSRLLHSEFWLLASTSAILQLLTPLSFSQQHLDGPCKRGLWWTWRTNHSGCGDGQRVSVPHRDTHPGPGEHL